MFKNPRLLKYALIVCTFLCFSLAGCRYDNEENLYPDPTPMADCDTIGLTYTADMKDFFDTRCALSGCHAPGNFDPDLSVWIQDSLYLGVLYSSACNASHATRLTLDDCEKARLRAWLIEPLE